MSRLNQFLLFIKALLVTDFDNRLGHFVGTLSNRDILLLFLCDLAAIFAGQKQHRQNDDKRQV